MTADKAVVLRDATIWEERAYALIKDEMRKRLMSFSALSAALERHGVKENPTTINRKLNRKRFSAGFMLACLVALEVDAVRMRDVLKLGARDVPAKANPQ